MNLLYGIVFLGVRFFKIRFAARVGKHSGRCDTRVLHPNFFFLHGYAEKYNSVSLYKCVGGGGGESGSS